MKPKTKDEWLKENIDKINWYRKYNSYIISGIRQYEFLDSINDTKFSTKTLEIYLKNQAKEGNVKLSKITGIEEVVSNYREELGEFYSHTQGDITKTAELMSQWLRKEKIANILPYSLYKVFYQKEYEDLLSDINPNEKEFKERQKEVLNAVRISKPPIQYNVGDKVMVNEYYDFRGGRVEGIVVEEYERFYLIDTGKRKTTLHKYY